MKTHVSATSYPSISLWGMRALLVVRDDDHCIPPRVTAFLHDGRRVASGETFDDLCAILSDVEQRPYAFPEVPEAFFPEDQMMLTSGKAFYALRKEIDRRGIVSWSDSRHFSMSDMIETALLAGFCTDPRDPSLISSDPRDRIVQMFQLNLMAFMPGRQVVRAEANTADIHIGDGEVIPGLTITFTVAIEIEDALSIQFTELDPKNDDLIHVNEVIIGEPGEMEAGFSIHDPEAPIGWYDDDDDDHPDGVAWIGHAVEQGEELLNRIKWQQTEGQDCAMCGRERHLNQWGRCAECETVWNS